MHIYQSLIKEFSAEKCQQYSYIGQVRCWLSCGGGGATGDTAGGGAADGGVGGCFAAGRAAAGVDAAAGASGAARTAGSVAAAAVDGDFASRLLKRCYQLKTHKTNSMRNNLSSR